MSAKGKRFMARLTKYLNEDRSLLLFTLLVAIFPQLDVVAQAPILDTVAPSEQRTEVELQTQMWVDHIPTFIMAAVSHASLHHISGWLGLLLHRMDVVAVANTQVCLIVAVSVRT
jgi:DNA topoisomerase 2-associated protein PAT1